jgi:hypothetical protein
MTMLRPAIMMLAIAMAGAGAQATRAPQDRLVSALQANRLSLTLGDGQPSGPGWDWLLQQARGARITVIGEEHGVAETAQLSSALFSALRPTGYSRVAIELSPAIARDVEAAGRRSGFQGIANFLTTPGIFTFYNMREEVQFLADVIKAAPGEKVLWGLDREIFSDRYLISRLEPKVPGRARDAFARLKQASENAKAQNERTGNPDDLFFLSQDSLLATALRAAWPNPDAESDAILRTIEGSLAVETAERNGGAWPYQVRRAEWMRSNMAALVTPDRAGGRNAPKVLMKFGYNHAIRGANYINVFDLGAMADEVAAITGDRAFHLLVIPGPGSQQAVLGGAGFGAVSSDGVDELRAGEQRITRVLPNTNATGHEVIDLRRLRPLAMRGLESWNADVVRTIHGYDAVVIWKGAHASSGLKP